MFRTRPYQNTYTEPDMRQELINTLDGKFPEVSKRQIAVLRKMRRDINGNLTQCVCVDTLTHEPTKDHFCPYCHSMGYYWDEVFIDMYKVETNEGSFREKLPSPGLINIPGVIFYLKASVDITKEDRIVEITLGIDGQPTRPYKRKTLYRIGALVDLRSDIGKLEYWKVNCYQEQYKFLNGVA